MFKRQGLVSGAWLLLFLLMGLAYIPWIPAYRTEANSLNQSNRNGEHAEHTKNEEDINLQLIVKATTDNKTPQSIDAYYTIEKGQISFDGTEAIPIRLLEQGKAQLGIMYCLRSDDWKIKKEENYKSLDSLSLLLADKEPYFRVINEKGSWGIGSNGVSVTDSIKKLLPQSLEGFQVGNSFTEDKGKYDGLITIYKADALPEQEEGVSLNSLGLSLEVISKIRQSSQRFSTLEILADYDFILDNPFPLRGRLTLRRYYQIDNNK